MSRTRRNSIGSLLSALVGPAQTTAILLAILLCLGACDSGVRYVNRPTAPEVDTVYVPCDSTKCKHECDRKCHRDCNKGDEG